MFVPYVGSTFAVLARFRSALAKSPKMSIVVPARIPSVGCERDVVADAQQDEAGLREDLAR